MSDAGKRRREKAAAAAAAANAGQKRRERTVRIVGAVTVLVVVVGIIGIAVWAKGQSGSGQDTASTVQPDPSAPSPKGVLPADDEHAYGVPYGKGAPGAPTLAIWEDFQCPACGSVEQANGAGIAKLAEDGTVNLIWRPTTFLDRNLGNDASIRAVGAWGCAIDAGKAREFHDVIYANQPETEGGGWTDEQLIGFADGAGITGAAKDAFTACVTAGTYQPWAANSSQIFYDSNIQGTPYASLDGQEVATEILADQAKLTELVTAAASK